MANNVQRTLYVYVQPGKGRFGSFFLKTIAVPNKTVQRMQGQIALLLSSQISVVNAAESFMMRKGGEWYFVESNTGG